MDNLLSLTSDTSKMSKEAVQEMDMQIIKTIERTTGVEYSEEQKEILLHRGGMCILAAAGSGKTSVLTGVLAKRIMSGEIKDTSKVMCSTYSKAGADEMNIRLSALLEKLGLKQTIQVKTLHALYLAILKQMNYPTDVIDNGTRIRYIIESCKEADYRLEDEDLQQIDSLLSYQINNLLSDEALVKSYVFTLENMKLEQYSKIRTLYNQKKMAIKKIDFDDMQLYVYSLLVGPQGKEIAAYCNSMWTDFYIDEAQDTSKIQFEIVRRIVSDPDKIVFIGDDDQCLVEDTIVETHKGFKQIQEIKPGYLIRASIGNGETDFFRVEHISKKKIEGNIIEIETRSGVLVRGTHEHIGFARIFRDIVSVDDRENEHAYIKSTLDTRTRYKHLNNLRLTRDENSWMFVRLGDMLPGMQVPVNVDGSIVADEIVSIREVAYSGYVFDLAVPGTRNFVANNLLVHNCIYKWRGADPGIILNINTYYDIKRFLLTTNYRCLSEIVDTAAVGIKFNQNRHDKTMKPFKQGGKIRIIDAGRGDLYNMSKYAFKHIKDLVDSGVSPSDIAILSRNNQHLSILNNMLYRDGIYSETSSEMRMTRSSYYKDIKNTIDIATGGYNHHTTANTLWKLVTFLGVSNSILISKIQDNSGLCLMDTLGFIFQTCDTYGDYGVSWSKTPKVPAKVKLQTMDIWNRAKHETKQALALVYNVLALDDESQRVIGLMQLYLDGSSFMLNNPDKARAVYGLVSYVTELVETIGVQNTTTLLKVTEQYEEARMAIMGPKINMVTMHGAKGREWKHVVMFADDNIAFPSFYGIRKMVGRGIQKSDLYNYIDEDRRLHYVAMTRAKEDLTIVANVKNLSVYTAEAIGAFDTTDNNHYILEFADKGVMHSKVRESILEKFNDKYKYDVNIDEIGRLGTLQDLGITTSSGLNINDMATGGYSMHGLDG